MFPVVGTGNVLKTYVSCCSNRKWSYLHFTLLCPISPWPNIQYFDFGLNITLHLLSDWFAHVFSALEHAENTQEDTNKHGVWSMGPGIPHSFCRLNWWLWHLVAKLKDNASVMTWWPNFQQMQLVTNAIGATWWPSFLLTKVVAKVGTNTDPSGQ